MLRSRGIVMDSMKRVIQKSPSTEARAEGAGAGDGRIFQVQIVAMLAHLTESGHKRKEVIELAEKASQGRAVSRERLLEMADHWHRQNFACSA